tara:strand:- start:157 stop:609 length:453 start_codon:yes stop_codon:yes gene_type:complete
MELKKLMVDSKSVWMDFPGLEGFSVEVANLSRKELTILRKKCTSQKFDRKTRQLTENLDEEKFVIEFSKASVKNWKGLTIDHLETLILIDSSEQEGTAEVSYSQENAEVLVQNSTEFDTWLNEVVFDLDNFRGGRKETSPKPTRKVSTES